MKKILIFSHLGLGDNIFCISMILYYLKKNYEVHYFCRKHNIHNFTIFFKHNENKKNLLLIPIKSGKSALSYIKEYKKLYNHIFRSGYSNNSILDHPRKNINNFPFFQYDDINLSRNILKEYFRIPVTKTSCKLYDKVKNINYIIVNNQTSDGELFNINSILSRYNIDIDKYLIINTQKNFYNKKHEYFSLAQHFVSRHLIDYSLILKYASKIIISDSSMFCLAIQLDLINKEHYVYVRNKNNRWDDLLKFYDNKFIISNSIEDELLQKQKIGIGEILDKLSILLIKLNNITDNDKLNNINYEYNILLNYTIKNINKNIQEEKTYNKLIDTYNELIDTNKKLWIIKDNLRKIEKIKIFDENFIINARCKYIVNDKRCYLKTILNKEYDSKIIEEKSYDSYQYNLDNSELDNKVKMHLKDTLPYEYNTTYISGENINNLCNISIYDRKWLNGASNLKKYIKKVIYVNENNNIETILDNQDNIFFIKTDYIYYFVDNILPLIKKPFIIVTHNSDYFSGILPLSCLTFDIDPKHNSDFSRNSLQKILNHPLLIKWYGRNMELINKKTEGIPIGLKNKKTGGMFIGLENRMLYRTNFNIIEKNKSNPKNKLLYLNFNERTNKNRKEVMKLFLERGFKKNNSLPWNDYIKELSFYKFAISPQGNGVDCHRTWECLYLGVIPIVERSISMSFFKELPILFVDNYEKITEDYLNIVYEKFNNSTFNLEKLNIDYYKQKITKEYEEFNNSTFNL